MKNVELERLLSYTETEVNSLLLSYAEYKELSKQIDLGQVENKSKPSFSFFKNIGKMQNLDPLTDAKKELNKIGEDMKFQNPLIWLTYKDVAYKNEPGKALNTLRDLREHCKVDGICFRRFDAINSYLRSKHNGLDLNSDYFLAAETRLEILEKDSRFIQMCLDKEFISCWHSNENDRSGKWKNYKISA